VNSTTSEDPGRSRPTAYALERTQHELDRLTLQDELLGDSTRSLFEHAGIGDGMRVLEVGSGAGDVALAMSRMVGPTGSVVGVELDPATAEAAARRIAEAGIGNVAILAGDVASLELPGPFDAAVGRLVLMHVPDPVSVLTRVRAALRPGGVAAFQETHLACPWLSTPSSPTLEFVERVARTHWPSGTRRMRTWPGGPRSVPRRRVSRTPANDPRDGRRRSWWAGYRYIEETVRGLLPMGSLGCGWRRRHRGGRYGGAHQQEVGETGSVLIHTLVGAWAATPDTDLHGSRWFRGGRWPRIS
jgi:protein-L-isoaspartate O-methyltransferase